MIRDYVRQFHHLYRMPIADRPSVPDKARIVLRLKLILEETFELLEACGIDWLEEEHQNILASLNAIDPDYVNLVEVADALGDIAYVVEGMNLEFGINSADVLDAIQKSNLSKLGPDGEPVIREDGKVIKGPFFSPPDIKGALGL